MKVGVFTDHGLDRSRSVTTTLHAALRHRPADVQARVYTLDAVDADEPDCVSLRAPGLAVSFDAEPIRWPRPGALLARARADGLDVVHVATAGPIGFAARHVAGHLGLPMVGSAHADGPGPADRGRALRLAPARRFCQRWIYGRCEPVLASTPAIARRLGDAGLAPARIRLWGRGVDVEAFTPARRSDAQRLAWGARRQPIVACAGPLSHGLGFELVPEISRSLRAHGHPHRLLFLGDGPLRRDLAAACPGAIFTGPVPPAHMPALLASADLLWCPSRDDAAGGVVLDAQACGLPVVIAQAGAGRDDVRHGDTGLVCGGGSPFTFELALGWLLRDAGRRTQMAAAARRHALTRTWPVSLLPLFDAWRAAHRRRAAAPRAPDRGPGVAPLGAGSVCASAHG